MIGLSLGINTGCLSAEDLPPVDLGADIDVVGSGSLVVTVVGESVEITITDAAPYDGTYTGISLADFEVGPVNLVAPTLLPTSTAEGGDLTITPGLWVYDADAGQPVMSYAHNGAGTISGTTYTSGTGDGGNTVTVTETADQGGGLSRSADSNAVAIAAASTSPTLTSIGIFKTFTAVGSDYTYSGIDLSGVQAGDIIQVVQGPTGPVTAMTIDGDAATIATSYSGNFHQSQAVGIVTATGPGSANASITVTFDGTPNDVLINVAIIRDGVFVSASTITDGSGGTVSLTETPGQAANLMVGALTGHPGNFSGDPETAPPTWNGLTGVAEAVYPDIIDNVGLGIATATNVPTSGYTAGATGNGADRMTFSLICYDGV